MENGFYWRLESDSSGLKFMKLGFSGGDRDNDSEVWIAVAEGSNMCKFRRGNRDIIDFDPKLLLQKDYTGTPVLYPTPNRVRNGVFVYKGHIFNQVKGGEPVFEHGLVHDEAWEYEVPAIDGAGVTFRTWIDFAPGRPVFDAFPFKSRLELLYRLELDGVEIKYSVVNNDTRVLPFGFGLHPYFMKLSGEEETYISLPANYVMDYTSDLLPTGRLIDVGGTIYDITRYVPIGKLDMDHVFTGMTGGESAGIEYRSLGIKVTLEATEDFSHLVLYSPRGRDFFCIENQTCSTDAHNLCNMGFIKESGLKVAAPGSTFSGSVKYRVGRI